MEDKENNRYFGNVLSYNVYTLMWIAMIVLFALLQFIDSFKVRSSALVVLWIVAVGLCVAEQVRLMKKYFLPRYHATGKFSVKHYIGMCAMMCFYLLILFMSSSGFIAELITWWHAN